MNPILPDGMILFYDVEIVELVKSVKFVNIKNMFIQ